MLILGTVFSKLPIEGIYGSTYFKHKFWAKWISRKQIQDWHFSHFASRDAAEDEEDVVEGDGAEEIEEEPGPDVMVSDQLGVDDHLLGVVLLHDALKSKEKFPGLKRWVQADLCCGSYKCSTIVIYNSRVVRTDFKCLSNVTLELNYNRWAIIRLATNVRSEW